MTSRRLFVALDLPGDLKDQLANLQASLRAHFPLARWVVPPQLHLTLKFLDQVDDTKRLHIEDTLSMVSQSHTPFDLPVGAVDFAPNHTMIWVLAVPDPALLELHQDLDSNMLPLGFAAERRQFLPHITLARLGQGYNGDIPFMVTWPGGRMLVDALSLYESRLEPHGSRYDLLARFPLGSGRV